MISTNQIKFSYSSCILINGSLCILDTGYLLCNHSNVPEEVPGGVQSGWQLQEAVLGVNAPVNRPLRRPIPGARLPLLHLHGVNFRHCASRNRRDEQLREVKWNECTQRLRPARWKLFQDVFIYTGEEESKSLRVVEESCERDINVGHWLWRNPVEEKKKKWTEEGWGG